MRGLREIGYSRDYRPDVDGLRAIAVSCVLFFHAEVPGFGGGFVGVDLFFVISGFLITRNIYLDHRDGRWSFTEFYLRRARRLLPALLVTLFFTFAAGVVFLAPEHLERLGHSLAYSTFFTSNFLFWSEAGYFDTSSDFKPLLHTWSLAVEEQYYLLWPALLVFGLTLRRRSALLGGIALFSLSLICGEILLRGEPAAVFYLMPFRFFEFLIGTATFWLSRYRARGGAAPELLTGSGLALIGTAVFGLGESSPFPGLHGLLPTIGAALIIAAGGPRWLGWLLTNRVSVYIGLISYSLYLVHWPVLIYYKYWWYRPLTGIERTALTLFCVAAASAMFHLVETPFRLGRGSTRLLSSRAFVSLCAGLSLLLLGMGSYTAQRLGFPDRIATRTAFNRTLDRDYECGLNGAEKRCLLGAKKEGKAEILVIGDSHANALRPLFDELGQRVGRKVETWTFLGCSPLFGTYKVYGVRSPRREKLCRAVIEQWERYVTANHFAVVALVARWDWLYEPVVYGDFEIRRDWLVAIEGSELTDEASRSVFAEKLYRTAETISERSSKLVIFGQAPVLAKHPGPCLTPGYFSTSGYSAKCEGVDFETKLGRLAYTDETIAATAARFGGKALAVLPSQHFCSELERLCVVVDGGKLLYDDTHHLNRFGNEYLLKRLGESFLHFFE